LKVVYGRIGKGGVLLMVNHDTGRTLKNPGVSGEVRDVLTEGFRESEESWKDVLLDVQRRGVTVDPRLAVDDEALGFWKALPQVWAHTRTQRCWVHKTVNVLNKFPKHLQANAKSARHQIRMASTREHAGQAFEAVLTTYTSKYPKAAEGLAKDRTAVLAFYDFPAEHWHHIRTTNPIESTVATVPLAKTRGGVSRTRILSMVFRLARRAEGHWVKLCRAAQMAKLMHGVPFKHGVDVQKARRQEIAA
jgi:putative transposase